MRRKRWQLYFHSCHIRMPSHTIKVLSERVWGIVAAAGFNKQWVASCWTNKPELPWANFSVQTIIFFLVEVWNLSCISCISQVLLLKSEKKCTRLYAKPETFEHWMKSTSVLPVDYRATPSEALVQSNEVKLPPVINELMRSNLFPFTSDPERAANKCILSFLFQPLFIQGR